MKSKFPDITRFDVVAFDTETTGLVQGRDRAFAFSLTLPTMESFYYDLRAQPQARDWINDQFKNYNGFIVCANASFDYRMGKAAGINVPLEALDDVIIRGALIDEHLPAYTLDFLANKYLGEKKVSEIYEELAGIFGGSATRKAQMVNLPNAPIEVVAPYAMKDTELTLRLWFWQETELEKQDLREIWEFERRLMPTLIRAEERGIRVDLDYAERAADGLTPLIEEEQKKLNQIAGREVNVNSSPQIRGIFAPRREKLGGVDQWVANDGTPLKETSRGAPSIDAEVLRSMKHPAAEKILSIRSLIKTRDTFLRGHVLGHSENGRVYPTINQSKGETGGTGTGRLSYQNPAMQQIPSRNKKVAAIVKPCFLPEEGQVWLDADMNSFEVRVFAHLINNERINKEYAANPQTDLHQFVGELTGLPRNATYSGEPNAKQLNLSMIFNSGNGAIAEKMGMPWHWESFTARDGTVITYKKAGPEAERVIQLYHERVPGVRELAERMKKRAEAFGFIRNYAGRKIRFPRGFKSYKASGLLIQSTAADLNKENWMLIEEALGGEGTIVLNTHDSYSMSVPEEWKPIWGRVREAVERPRLRVPLLLDLNGVGNNWWEALQGE